MIDKNIEVLVAGAGPVGLCTALFLADRGIRVSIVEEQWKTAARSYALALHASSLRRLQKLGIARQLIPQGNPIRSLAVYREEERRLHLNLQEVTGDFRMVLALPQQQLEEALISKLEERGVKVLWNHRVAAVDPSASGNRAVIEKLSKDSTGYSISRTEWVVDRTFETVPAFIVAADGHRSAIREMLGIEFEDLGDPRTFTVFEFQSDASSEDELKVVLNDGNVSVLWPLNDGRFRWSFEIPETEEVDPRVKSRLLVQLREKTYTYVTEEKLRELIRQRAPWFQTGIRELIWSAAIRFERRLAADFGKGRVSLAGDAAHMALPMGIQSMNFGFREAETLASVIAEILKGGKSLELLSQTRTELRNEWIRLLEMSRIVQEELTCSDWIREAAPQLIPCIPASGEDLNLLIRQLES